MTNLRRRSSRVAAVPLVARVPANTLVDGQEVAGIDLLLNLGQSLIVLLSPESSSRVGFESVSLVLVGTGVRDQLAQRFHDIVSLLKDLVDSRRVGICGIKRSSMNGMPHGISPGGMNGGSTGVTGFVGLGETL